MEIVTSYRERRLELLSKLKDGIAIIPAGTEKVRSFDTHYTFRQDTDFKYLTGFSEPEAILVLCQHHDKFKQILFLRPKDALAELWDGKRLGVEKSIDLLEVDHAYPIDQFDSVIGEYLKNHKRVFLNPFTQQELTQKMMNHCKKLHHDTRKQNCFVPNEFHNVTTLIGKMKLYKTQNEIQFIKSACAITTKAHKASMAFTEPGKNEYEVNALIDYIFQKNGSSGPAYGSIVAAGNNANCLHYTENNSVMNDGDLLLIDAGSEYNVYASDVTRTFPINGTYTKEQQAIYEIVLESQKTAISLIKPGKNFDQLNVEVIKVLTQGLLDLGIMKGELNELIETKKYREYYPHGLGHWMGLDVHDNCPYLDDKNEKLGFKEGMVFTIEPGLYFNTANTDVPEKYRGIGVRIEDDILITNNSYEVLTSAIPKEVKDVEIACKEDYREYL